MSWKTHIMHLVSSGLGIIHDQVNCGCSSAQIAYTCTQGVHRTNNSCLRSVIGQLLVTHLGLLKPFTRLPFPKCDFVVMLFNLYVTIVSCLCPANGWETSNCGVTVSISSVCVCSNEYLLQHSESHQYSVCVHT